MSVSLIILAAGQGTRMNSDLPKVLHPLAGAPLLVHAMLSGAAVSPEKTVVVAGHEADVVEKAAKAHDPEVTIVTQDEQLGTGHAVLQARDALADFDGDAVVLFGDTPFIRPETIGAMVTARSDHAVVVLGFEAEDPKRYGRLVMSGNTLERIVEYKDATEKERAISLCNGGVVTANAQVLFDLLDAVGNDNASGEYYLTDIVGIARERGLSATAVTCPEAETQGINTRQELAKAETTLQSHMRSDALDNGVTMSAPETVFFSHDTVIGRDATIEPNVFFGPGVTIETGAKIRAFSHLEGCHVARGSIVGPYARLRPGTELSEDVRVGNFVEIKNSTIAEGAKVNHLSYIGDAEIGKATNIGAGTITCNYDGVMKHKTTIGERSFIGSNTMLIAPVTVADDTMTASGSVITKDVEAKALAIARAQQVNKPGLAVKMFEKLKNLKAKRDKGTK
ncbi:bifunctional UDP-N-acetylglucosamine diphosphorylase/glucosamine-1-phosphate N-acetyltransferase GlmU [Pseudohalocynthiibacter sp. F2068]|jgi:bifunctional UDP-N-acetylglucosamine pyrophosphorylase / glucosamine-1-phosphate N-acetyltransferase|uniref:bifunctional UDP-N-acetylglucosamine diphosphorylase/glucosamine-1-phosphate N-acetyltransferase GlmU n=1 Tax=Pseudohalocynthiibacter sp. F2068 TaxID=2926418 RepID=UPI001FF29993|nr:bifunctional UDP-N-acetylglucosamine diphosphorylase/glucosamine-1-phosphate N-acetyltransferase GlmU [Pseudohalocynthiibacter sp. F2068]MCK0101805.1 bifunctional UDP-N-acetylglucosamine diphosphorylase/glucosamine-1-phosphate N-acetyltransferase GlmU [Pseudohalocynthiibacter sp. F2068]